MRLLRSFAREQASGPLSLALARLAISRVDRRAHHDANALAVAHFVRRWVRYTHESPETVCDLERLAVLQAGDCDDMACACAALLLRLGYRVRFVVGHLSWPAHIWVQAWSPRLGRWLDLDPSTHRVDPGQSPASVRPFRKLTHHEV